MKATPLGEFARMAGGRLHGIGEGETFRGFALDSREVKPGNLFIAVQGERADGHDFAKAACDRGAVAVLAEREVPAPCVIVSNVVRALGTYAGNLRDRFAGPVIAVTGSVGKTTTKEFLAAALAPLGPVVKSEGNRNSEFTTPLLWAEVDKATRAVVVEMGMRGFGQIEYLASFAKPTIGIITNVGYSHAELVGGIVGVARAKAELVKSLPSSGYAVLPSDDSFLTVLVEQSAALVHTFGTSKSAECRVTSCDPIDWRHSRVHFKLSLDGAARRLHTLMPSIGKHNAVNAAAALLAAALAGVDPQEAASAMEHAQLPPLRMEIIEYNGATIVLDAYNASPTSVIAALETLRDLPASRRIAILGEMRELGEWADSKHRDVGYAMGRCKIDFAVLLGKPALSMGSAARAGGMDPEAIRYVDTVHEIGRYLKTLQPGDVALIKGSRALEMERALDALKEPAC